MSGLVEQLREAVAQLRHADPDAAHGVTVLKLPGLDGLVVMDFTVVDDFPPAVDVSPGPVLPPPVLPPPPCSGEFAAYAGLVPCLDLECPDCAPFREDSVVYDDFDDPVWSPPSLSSCDEGEDGCDG